MAKGKYRWPCGCEGVFDGLDEVVTAVCSKHDMKVGNRLHHRNEPKDNGAKPIDFLPKAGNTAVTAQIDWVLLRRQKETLIRVSSEFMASTVLEDAETAADLNGIVHLIDALQDEADDAGVPNVFEGGVSSED